jgi:uncharacterized membrane protein
MAQWIVAYLLALVLFAAIDITWLMSVGGKLYKETLGDILLADIRLGPAAAFYLFYPAGLVTFGVAPGLRDGSIGTAGLMGAAFGLFAYGTYELTNFATLRNWTLSITVIDMVYGLIASGLVALLVTAALPSVMALLNSSR